MTQLSDTTNQWIYTCDPHFRRGGAENAFDVQERMVEALREIVAAHEGKRIAVFSHEIGRASCRERV